MLKTRLLTALILLPLALAAIFLLPVPWFVVVLAGIMLGGCHEYGRLAGLSRRSSHFLIILQAIILIALFTSHAHWADTIMVLLIISCGLWLLMFVRLFLFRPAAVVNSAYRVASSSTAIISLTTGWLALSWLRSQPEGAWLILLLLLIVWSADTGAYFAGRAFGKRKLAANISPGKTQAGFFGGLLVASLVTVLAAAFMPVPDIGTPQLVGIALLTAFVSVGGDLLISLHKRLSGHKDSGSLLPGHGGILDRIDSLLASSPFFALGILLAG